MRNIGSCLHPLPPFNPKAYCGEISCVWTQQVSSQDKWTRGGKPDGLRVDEILPVFPIIDHEARFVGCSSPLLDLMNTHLDLFINRKSHVGVIEGPIGIGKTSFAKKYLALVSRHWRDHGIARRFQCGFSREFSHARTLMVPLPSATSPLWQEKFRDHLITAVAEQWHVLPPRSMDNVWTWIAEISPAVVVFDDIEYRFDSSESFDYFVKNVCLPIAETKGLYPLLVGRIDGLVGGKSQTWMKRISLGPINAHDVTEIIKHTLYRDPTLGTRRIADVFKYPRKGLCEEEYVERLIRVSKGNPGEITKLLAQHDFNQVTT
jgi:hypothetical protein